MTTIADEERNLIDGKRCMTDDEFNEFVEDGNQLLDYFLDDEVRRKYFSTTRHTLAGIETSIDLEVRNNVGYIGFLDVVLFDKINQKYKIIAFVDEDESKIGYKINNIKIIHSSSVQKYLKKVQI